MSIKSDKWIRRMALEHGMIEPFEPNQIKQNKKGRVVSYGTSSYGYDIRCSNDFKIFTNINSAIVDPKNFDSNSFVDFRGEVCIIPPNSFALARTVEYFRIPRNVLTICLGKCVTGDTRVVDAETGAYAPITEFSWGRRTLGLQDWRLQPGRVTAFVPQGKKPVFELITKAGLRIRATHNHPFRQLHGWTPLGELEHGDRIAVARTIPVFGKTPLPDWEATLLGLMIAAGHCRTLDRSPVVTICDPVLVKLLGECIEEGGLGAAVHKPNGGCCLINGKGRGGKPRRNRAAIWLKRYGLAVTAKQKFVPQAIFTAPRESVRLFLQVLVTGQGGVYRSGDSCFIEYCCASRRLSEDVHHLLLRFGVFSMIREKQTHIGTTTYRIRIAGREQILRFFREIGFWPASEQQLRLEKALLPDLLETPARLHSSLNASPAAVCGTMNQAVAKDGIGLIDLGSKTNSGQSPPHMLATKVAYTSRDSELSPLLDGPVWDVVTEIKPVGEEEVYDLTVHGMHNFVANDLIVHNSTYARCGIIVNVTPFEPEWEGYVTLEFSNTTPLPAKIYANEGVAQVIFFEADEECETSYKDRGGKYQGQTGVTLPKT